LPAAAGEPAGEQGFADTVRGPKGKGSNGADTASRTCLPAGSAAAGQKWKIIYLQVLKVMQNMPNFDFAEEFFRKNS